MESPLREKFKSETVKKLQAVSSLKNILALPRLEKGIIQIGVGKMIIQNPEAKERILEEAQYALSQLTGQKAIVVKAKKSVAGFKLREEQPVAVLVTLRKNYLYDFVDRLTTYVLPRLREFKGLDAKSFDKKGNINLGFRELSIFPEAISDKIKVNFGLQITLVATAKNFSDKLKLWEALGFPVKI